MLFPDWWSWGTTREISNKGINVSGSQSSIQALGRVWKWHLGHWLLLFSLIAKSSLKSLGESGSTKSLGSGVGGRGSFIPQFCEMGCGESLRPQPGESQRRGEGQGGKHWLVPLKWCQWWLHWHSFLPLLWEANSLSFQVPFCCPTCGGEWGL